MFFPVLLFLFLFLIRWKLLTAVYCVLTACVFQGDGGVVLFVVGFFVAVFCCFVFVFVFNLMKTTACIFQGDGSVVLVVDGCCWGFCVFFVVFCLLVRLFFVCFMCVLFFLIVLFLFLFLIQWKLLTAVYSVLTACVFQGDGGVVLFVVGCCFFMCFLFNFLFYLF